jgi:hypothetical protein
VDKKEFTEDEVREYMNITDIEGVFKCGQCGKTIAEHYYKEGQQITVTEIFDELDYSMIRQDKKWLCIDPKRYQVLKSRYNIKDN